MPAEGSPMYPVAVVLWALREAYHDAHNLTMGAAFHGDHAFYDAARASVHGAFDAVCERIRLSTGALDKQAIRVAAMPTLAATVTDWPAALLEGERSLLAAIEAARPGLDLADETLLGDIANDAKAERAYQLNQRATP